MIGRVLTACCLALLPIAAQADCQDGIAHAQARAEAMPDSPGKAALLEQIQRAANERHEGDEAGCQEALSSATDVLKSIDTYNNKTKAAATPHLK